MQTIVSPKAFASKFRTFSFVKRRQQETWHVREWLRMIEIRMSSWSNLECNCTAFHGQKAFPPSKTLIVSISFHLSRFRTNQRSNPSLSLPRSIIRYPSKVDLACERSDNYIEIGL
mmetsp:Transcript_13511/g.28384  ORF Transcript_13511/g.28384 Transcript_13511/m.28384 type:complete len:116 (+) Transcript_13511:12-359(+)